MFRRPQKNIFSGRRFSLVLSQVLDTFSCRRDMCFVHFFFGASFSGASGFGGLKLLLEQRTNIYSSLITSFSECCLDAFLLPVNTVLLLKR
jgi:hypothetical protein